MKLNEDVLLTNANPPLALVPYTTAHVPRYHAWMQSPQLLELTASEPLSLSDEHENMNSWREDPSKLTFIIIDTSFHPPTMAGDVNLYVLHNDGEHHSSAEVEVMIAEEKSRRKRLAQQAVWMMMAFALQHMKIDSFVAKILDHNVPSITLFTSHLPFKEERRVTAFNEIHYRVSVDRDLRNKLESVRSCWTQRSYKDSPLSKAIYLPEDR